MPYWAAEGVTLHLGDCLAILPSLPDSSIDAIVTDPPYGLEFMGREWDGADGFRRSLNAADAGRDSVFGRTSRTSPEYKTGKPTVPHINADAGFSPPGLSDGGRRLPRPTFTGSTNPHCRNCKGRERGRRDGTEIWKTCTCDNPDFPNIRAIEMGTFQAWCEVWAAECLRLLRPGGYLLAFGGTRTWHRMVCAIEDAGFEIRDSIDWIYGSGFPKNPACLKPAHEPIVMARKPSLRSEPLPGLKSCQVGPDVDTRRSKGHNPSAASAFPHSDDAWVPHVTEAGSETGGRWPPNVVLSEAAAAELDRQSGVLTSGSRKAGTYGLMGYGGHDAAPMPEISGDSGGASRFFPVFRYEAKAPAHERPRLPDGTAHPTVKPLDLIRWLVRLVTPPGGTVLDPFAGSGTTGEACVIEGFSCILAEQDPKSAEMVRVRLSKPIQPVMFGESA